MSDREITAAESAGRPTASPHLQSDVGRPDDGVEPEVRLPETDEEWTLAYAARFLFGEDVQALCVTDRGVFVLGRPEGAPGAGRQAEAPGS